MTATVQERRWHPLLEQWTIVAGASQTRPWSGTTVGESANRLPAHDPSCYLCPGVTRASGKTNPHYTGCWSFDNDFASLSPTDTPEQPDESALRRSASSQGRCRVLCWSEKHDQRLASLDDSQLLDVGRLWQSEFILLRKDPTTRQIVMFENSGAEVGVSNHHPHGQVYATSFITDNGERLRHSQQHYAQQNDGRSLLQDLIAREEYQDELLVEQHQYCRTIVPYAARFPYETWIVPERHVSTIAELSDEERDDMVLASAKQSRRYEALFGRVSPNITLFFNAPVDDHPGNQHWCYHIVQQPPLRDAKRMKYLAGFESAAANIINPVQPEQAAQQLRAASVRIEDIR